MRVRPQDPSRARERRGGEALSDWRPDATTPKYGRPLVGRLLGHLHGVWRVTAVTEAELSEEDRAVWLAAGRPDLNTWPGRPFEVHLEFVGGLRPDWAPDDDVAPTGRLPMPAGKVARWHVYEGDRWPMCSCCGEPTPCRATIEDREVATSLRRIDRLAQRKPGHCWGCEEPIGRRQKAVAYPGDNLDLPGGPEVVFHTRWRCWGSAKAYELRWIMVDPRNERILTWPRCGGILVVHADGSSECQSGTTALFGTENRSEPNCQGHLTHDHGVIVACFSNDRVVQPDRPGCMRGCARASHRGTWLTPRPPRTPTSHPTDHPTA